MRVLLTSGYNHPSHFRKLELLADAPDVELLNLQIYTERPEGRYPSADGQRTYVLRHLPTWWPRGDFDPHRAIHIPPRLRLREFKPDIIHSEHEQESLGAAQLALARTLRTPHTPLLLYSWQNLIRPRSLPVRLVCAYTLRAAQYFMCASQEAIDVLRQQGYQGGASVIPIVGLDTRFFYPKRVDGLRRQLGLEGIVVGYLGRLVKEKGLDTLLHAVAAARATQPNLRLLLVGSGPEQAVLQALADRLGITDISVFHAAVSHDQVVDYMNAMDIFVLPSRTTPHWKEQLGRVLYEAMGCRVAVIGSDSGSIPEVIGDGGLVFPENDATVLADAIRLLAGQTALRTVLARRGYTRAVKRYSVERIAQDTLILWRELVAQSARRTDARLKEE